MGGCTDACNQKKERSQKSRRRESPPTAQALALSTGPLDGSTLREGLHVRINQFTKRTDSFILPPHDVLEKLNWPWRKSIPWFKGVPKDVVSTWVLHGFGIFAQAPPMNEGES